MEGRNPNRRGESLSPRQKRVFVIVTGVLLALAASVSVWAAVTPGSYGRSANGCVNVVEPSSMGGAIIHQCGADARALCRRAYAGTGRLDQLTRPQCRLAGIPPRRRPLPPATP